MYRAGISWGIAPSEFWALTVSEFFELAYYHSGESGGAGVAGTTMTQDRLAELDDWAAQVKAKRNGAATD